MSARLLYANNLEGVLLNPISESTTSIELVDGTKFPDLSDSLQSMRLTIENAGIIEIIEYKQKVGNTLVNVSRGLEDTVAQVFPAGTLIENRLTADSLHTFYAGDVVYIDDLSWLKPESSEYNTYIVKDIDTKKSLLCTRDSNSTFSFSEYRLIGSSTTTFDVSGISSSKPSLIKRVKPYRYIVEITTGSLIRYAYILSSTDTSFTVPLYSINPGQPSTFKIFESLTSILSGLEDLVYTHHLLH